MIRSYSENADNHGKLAPARPMEMEIVTDPAELARSRAQWERFERNVAWLQSQAEKIYSECRGKCICIAGEELFVGETASHAIELARSAHPDDDGLFVRYIPPEKVARIYAN